MLLKGFANCTFNCGSWPIKPFWHPDKNNNNNDNDKIFAWWVVVLVVVFFKPWNHHILLWRGEPVSGMSPTARWHVFTLVYCLQNWVKTAANESFWFQSRASLPLLYIFNFSQTDTPTSRKSVFLNCVKISFVCSPCISFYCHQGGWSRRSSIITGSCLLCFYRSAETNGTTTSTSLTRHNSSLC